MTELEGILRAGEFLFSGSLLILGRPVSGTGVIKVSDLPYLLPGIEMSDSVGMTAQ